MRKLIKTNIFIKIKDGILMVKIRPIIEGDLFQFRIWIKTLPLSINEFAGVKLDHICYLCLSE